MTEYAPYALFLALVAALVLAEWPSLPKWKVAAHALLALSVVAVGVDVQGRPKPLWAEWRDRGELEVISAMYHPGEGIYVLIRDAGPRLYALEWDVGLAREMQMAMQQSGGVLLKQGDREKSDDGLGGPWEAHPLPVPSNPPKEEG